jgi:hypothetical protein
VNNLRRNYSGNVYVSGTILERVALGQQTFHRVLSLEQRRAERSGKSFLVMLVDVNEGILDRRNSHVVSERILAALMPVTRETDVIGWYNEGSVAGVLFTEIAIDDLPSTTTAIMNRVSKTLKHHLTVQQFRQIDLSFHVLPNEPHRMASAASASSAAFAEVSSSQLATELR